jgi:hypothetical protein
MITRVAARRRQSGRGVDDDAAEVRLNYRIVKDTSKFIADVDVPFPEEPVNEEPIFSLRKVIVRGENA